MVDIDARNPPSAMVETQRLPVFKVVSVTFRVIARAWLPLYAMALVITLLGVPLNPLVLKLTTAFQTATAAHKPPLFPPNVFAEIGGLLLAQMVLSLFAFAAIQSLTIRTIDGENAGATWRVALVRVFPMVVSSIAVDVMMTVGFLLLIVPGVVVGAVYGLAPTACVVERRGPFASLSRSADLTRSNRLRCIAATVLLFFVPMLVAIAIDTLGQRLSFFVVGQVYSLAGSFLTLPILYVFPAVLLRELRLIKEGGARSGVAAVF